MDNFKKEMILNVAEDIKKYMWDKHAVDVDMYDIAYFIHDGLGFLFGAVEELNNERNENPDRVWE
jgi:hypothetical protein